jgi:hypothetical protein
MAWDWVNFLVRRMSDVEFRLRQYQRRYDPHVKPINELVDRLRDPQGRGWVPYIAPVHGGVDSWILSILRDPGPATQDGVGSVSCALRMTTRPPNSSAWPSPTSG